MISVLIFFMNGRGCKKKFDSLMVLNDVKVDILSLKKGVFFNL